MSPGFRFSVGVNLALLALVAFLLARGPSAAPPPLVPLAGPATARPASAATGGPPRAAPAESVRAPLTPAAVAELERMGIAHEVLVDVVLGEVNRRSTQRLADLQRRYAPRQVPDRAQRALAREEDAERARELTAAFGEAGYRDWDKAQALHELNAARPPGDELPMSAAEAEQAYQAQRAFDARSRDLQKAVEDGDADAAEAGALLAQAQQALDGRLRQVLGDQRFNALRGNADPTAQVYQQYGNLNPTPDQAQAVVAVQQDSSAREAALTEQLKAGGGDPAAVMAGLKAIGDARDAALRQMFGAQAYDAMKLQSDPTYASLQKYASVWGLSGDDIQSAYADLHAFQAQADLTRTAAAIRDAAGQPVDWRAVNASIDQSRAQTEAALQNLLGPDRLGRLEQNGMLTVH